MDHPCSAWADLLSKFQTSPPWIQALWLVLVAAVALGAVRSVADVVKHAMGALGRRTPSARLVYGLVQDADGRWLVCIEGEATAVGDDRGQAALDLVRSGGPQASLLPPRG